MTTTLRLGGGTGKSKVGWSPARRLRGPGPASERKPNSIESPALRSHERRRLVVSHLVAASADPELSGVAAALQRLCRAMTDALDLRGAALHLMAGHEGTGVVSCSDADARAVAELQFTSNEGPALVAFHTRRPVLLPELRLEADRWPGFCSLALDRGVRGHARRERVGLTDLAVRIVQSPEGPRLLRPAS